MLLEGRNLGNATTTNSQGPYAPISNGVPAFRKPKSRNAATTLLLLGLIAITMMMSVIVLAREMGLDVVFQSSRWVETYSRSGDLTFYNGHVNLVLARAALPASRAQYGAYGLPRTPSESVIATPSKPRSRSSS